MSFISCSLSFFGKCSWIFSSSDSFSFCYFQCRCWFIFEIFVSFNGSLCFFGWFCCLFCKFVWLNWRAFSLFSEFNRDSSFLSGNRGCFFKIFSSWNRFLCLFSCSFCCFLSGFCFFGKFSNFLIYNSSLCFSGIKSRNNFLGFLCSFLCSFLCFLGLYSGDFSFWCSFFGWDSGFFCWSSSGSSGGYGFFSKWLSNLSTLRSSFTWEFLKLLLWWRWSFLGSFLGSFLRSFLWWASWWWFLSRFLWRFNGWSRWSSALKLN